MSAYAILFQSYLCIFKISIFSCLQSRWDSISSTVVGMRSALALVVTGVLALHRSLLLVLVFCPPLDEGAGLDNF